MNSSAIVIPRSKLLLSWGCCRESWSPQNALGSPSQRRSFSQCQEVRGVTWNSHLAHVSPQNQVKDKEHLSRIPQRIRRHPGTGGGRREVHPHDSVAEPSRDAALLRGLMCHIPGPRDVLMTRACWDSCKNQQHQHLLPVLEKEQTVRTVALV